MYFLYILFAILIFGILILVHELGHFLTAKLFKVKVNEFSIFMGPALWKRQRGETLYAIRCIPLGGYCAMEGEDQESNDPRAFGNAKWWKKIITLAAGACMNFLLGFLLVLMLVCFSGFFPAFATPVLESVEPGSSFSDRLQAGDQIYEIDGERVYTSDDITTLLSLNLSGQENIHNLVIIRDGEKITLGQVNMEPRELPDGSGGASLRYGMNLTTVPRNLGNILSHSWNMSVNYVRTVRLSLQLLIQGRVGLDEMTGPVGIVKTIADIGTSSTQTMNASAGIWNVISIASFIAINLGVMNLLPIPALDGGQIFLMIVNGIYRLFTRRNINPRYLGYVNAAGFFCLIALMVLVAISDVTKFIL